MWFGKSAPRSSCAAAVRYPGPAFIFITWRKVIQIEDWSTNLGDTCQLGNFGSWLYSGSSPLPTHSTLSDLTGIQIKCHRFWESRRCEVPLPPDVTMTPVYFTAHGRSQEWKKFSIVPNTADSACIPRSNKTTIFLSAYIAWYREKLD